MAGRKLVVEIVGDASSLERTFKRTSVAANQFDRNVTHAFRGVVSGSGIMRSFTRSLAFASGGFLAFEGVTRFLEESISVAREAAVSQKSLAAQMKTSGESFAANREAIEKAGLSLAKYGFTSEDSEKALVVLDRATGNITKSIQLQGLVADLARAKNIDLAAAANVVAKVFGGQTTALRRAVPGLNANAKGWDLIREAQAKLAGQAAAATTPEQKFAAELHETQRIIGTALLPTVNKYLTSLGDWLDKMNRSGKLQRDVNQAVKAATPFFEALGKAAGLAAEGLGKYEDVLVALQQKSKGGGIGGVLSDAARFFIDPGFALGNAADFANRLFGGKTPEQAGADTAKGFMSGFGRNLFAPTTTGAFGKFVKNIRAAAAEALAKGGPTVEQRNAAFDATINRQLGRVQDIATVSGQIARLKQIAELITKRIAVTKDVTRKLKLEDDLLGVFRQIKADRQQLAQNAIDALSLNVDRAGLTKSLTDDIAALETVNAKLAQQQKLYGYTIDREQQIIGNQQQIQALEEQQRQNAKDRRDKAFQDRLDRAQLAISRAETTKSLTDDLAAEQNMVAIIQTQIRVVGHTVDLENQLLQHQQAIRDLKAQQQQNVFDRLDLNVQKAQLTRTLADDIAAVEAEQEAVEEQIRATGRTLELERTLIGLQLQVQQLREQRAKNQKDAARKATLVRQFRAIGLTATGEQPTPSGEALQRRLVELRKQVQDIDLTGTGLNRAKLRTQFEQIAKLLAQGVDKVKQPVRAAIDSIFDTIDSAIKDRAGKTLKHFQRVSGSAFVDAFGQGLTVAQKRRIERGLAVMGPGGTIPGGRSGQFTGGTGAIVVHGDIHVHGVQDVGAFENQLAKRAKSRAHLRRGARE